jgi:Predicted phosphohydrolases
MTKKITCVLFVALSLIVIFLSGCSKDNISEEKKIEYYELNLQNWLRLWTPVFLHSFDNINEELFKIVHISDVHVSSWSTGNNSRNPNNLKEAVRFANEEVTGINAMVATGDHIGNHITTTRKEAIGFLEVFTSTLYKDNQIPTFISTGNHDANMMNPDFNSYTISKSELYNLTTSKINYAINQDGIENYYYADVPNPMGGIVRIIALDVTDQDDLLYDAQHNAVFSQKQIDWLCRTALKKDMTEQHSVIILLHHPLPPNDEELKETIPSDFLYNWHLIPEIVETFRSKQTLTQKYKNKLNETDSISVDISFANVPGEFICYMGGHLHTYLNYDVRCSINSTLPKQIMILANNMSPSDISPTTYIERSYTGLRNNTFNIYSIDTKNKIIHVTFFGATSFYFPQILSLPYL